MIALYFEFETVLIFLTSRPDLSPIEILWNELGRRSYRLLQKAYFLMLGLATMALLQYLKLIEFQVYGSNDEPSSLRSLHHAKRFMFMLLPSILNVNIVMINSPYILRLYLTFDWKSVPQILKKNRCSMVYFPFFSIFCTKFLSNLTVVLSR